MPDNTFVSVDYRVYGELVAGKATADALKAMIRNKMKCFGEVSRAEVELLYALYCEDGEKA
jgi:hypothetical protein